MGNKRTQKINVFYTIIKITKQSVRVLLLVLKIYKDKKVMTLFVTVLPTVSYLVSKRKDGTKVYSKG